MLKINLDLYKRYDNFIDTYETFLQNSCIIKE